MAKWSSFTIPLSLLLLLLLLLRVVAGVQLEAASVPMKTFHYVRGLKSWSEARRYCVNKGFTDLASAASHREELLKETPFGQAWIGLYRDPADASVWRWTGESGDASSDPNWARGEPGTTENCGMLLSLFADKWHGDHCSRARPFVCFADNVILVKENKTWEEALEHCRAIGSTGSGRYRDHHHHHHHHQHDLVSLRSEDDHRYARDKIQEATTNEVWTGLRFLAGRWFWADGGGPQRYHDLPLCPAWGRHCGTLPKDHGASQWQIRDCMERRNFLCVKSPATHEPEEDFWGAHIW